MTLQATDRLSLSKVVIDEIESLLPDLKDEVEPDSHFIDDLDLDSLDVVEVVSRLEGRLGLSIPASVEESATSPATLAEAILRLEQATR